MIDDYRKNYLAPVNNAILKGNEIAMRNYSGINRALAAGPALPLELHKDGIMAEMEVTKELMNKVMKKYIE